MLVGDPGDIRSAFAALEPPPGYHRQTDKPCQLHVVHTPVTVLNEGHHMFPVYLQADAYGDNVIHEPWRQDVCGTGHNTVHTAINAFFKSRTRSWPRWCVGDTRQWAAHAVTRWAEVKGVDLMDPGVRPTVPMGGVLL